VQGYSLIVGFPWDVSKLRTIDSGNIRISYAFNAMDINDITTYDDLHRLDIGTHVSRYYSYLFYKSDSVCTDWKKKHPQSSGSPWGQREGGKDDKWSEYYSSEYFKDFSKNVFTEYTRMPRFLESHDCQVSEDIPVQDWKLHEDTLTVCGYICQKATCRFRGRDYTAWFTADIPINNGPWKFGGLPGLILKVYDMDELYVFECIRVEYYTKKFPVMMYDFFVRFPKSNREKLLALQKKIHENITHVVELIITSKTSRPVYQKVVYYPMELE
jgi:GLPGLI family protein